MLSYRYPEIRYAVDFAAVLHIEEPFYKQYYYNMYVLQPIALSGYSQKLYTFQGRPDDVFKSGFAPNYCISLYPDRHAEKRVQISSP